MLKTATVEKTTTYKLTKQDIVDILKKEAGLEGMKGVTVTFGCSGGLDPYDDRSYTPMDLYSATITFIERS